MTTRATAAPPVCVRSVSWPEPAAEPRVSRWAPLANSALLSSRAGRLATTLGGGLLGGAVIALLGLAPTEPEPAERVALTAGAVRAGAVALRAATRAVAEADREEGVRWWKRPTPMDPADAAQHIADAWQRAFGEAANRGALSILWAQWALETGRGRWMVDYNFAGLKGRAPDGGSAFWWTWEETESGPRRVRSRFRAYATPEQGADDYLLMLERRYPDAIAAARRGDSAGFIQALERRGYFTEDPKAYGRAVASLAREFAASPLGHAPGHS